MVAKNLDSFLKNAVENAVKGLDELTDAEANYDSILVRQIEDAQNSLSKLMGVITSKVGKNPEGKENVMAFADFCLSGGQILSLTQGEKLMTHIALVVSYLESLKSATNPNTD